MELKYRKPQANIFKTARGNVHISMISFYFLVDSPWYGTIGRGSRVSESCLDNWLDFLDTRSGRRKSSADKG
jgi:hypothetical protein